MWSRYGTWTIDLLPFVADNRERLVLKPASSYGGHHVSLGMETDQSRWEEIRRIADEDAGLGRELETTVRTGTFCAYEPDPRRPVAWDVDAA